MNNQAQRLADALFYNKDSEDGMMKQQFLNGGSPLGRICSVGLGGRACCQRMTIADFEYHAENTERLTITNDEKVRAEFFARIKAEGRANPYKLFSMIMEHVLAREGYKLASRFMEEEEYSSMVCGCQIEIYLFCTKNQTGFLYEIFPEIEGINTDQVFGSNLRATTTNLSPGGKDQEFLCEEMKDYSRFMGLAFGERLAKLSKNPMTKESVLDLLFDQEMLQTVKGEWSSGASLWEIRQEQFVAAFLGGFIGSFIRQHRLGNTAIGLSRTTYSDGSGEDLKIVGEKL